MDVTELKALEARANPAPWGGVPLSSPNIPFMVALRNVAPELLDLWEALNEWDFLRIIAGKPSEARSYEGGLISLNEHIREAEWRVRSELALLNEKAKSMAD